MAIRKLKEYSGDCSLSEATDALVLKVIVSYESWKIPDTRNEDFSGVKVSF